MKSFPLLSLLVVDSTCSVLSVVAPGFGFSFPLDMLWAEICHSLGISNVSMFQVRFVFHCLSSEILSDMFYTFWFLMFEKKSIWEFFFSIAANAFISLYLAQIYIEFSTVPNVLFIRTIIIQCPSMFKTHPEPRCVTPNTDETPPLIADLLR